MKRRWWTIFFPPLCAGCEQVLADDEEGICDKCRAALQYTNEATIRQNKLEMLFANFHPYHKETAIADKFIRAAAYTYYAQSNPIRDIIHAIKFKHNAELARHMGRCAAQRMRQNDFFAGIDAILPVPLHPKRLRERGYNQSEEIARGVSEVTGLPILNTCLERIQYTEQQSLKTIEERKKLPQPFALRNEQELQGKHVLVIDDVVTSGTTVGRCLELLHPIVGCHYSVMALSIAGEAN